jgi:hypothetical protein
MYCQDFNIQQYWLDIWSNEVIQNQTASWIAEEKSRTQHTEYM